MTTFLTDIHTYRHLNSPNKQTNVFGLWEETRVPGRNPHSVVLASPFMFAQLSRLHAAAQFLIVLFSYCYYYCQHKNPVKYQHIVLSLYRPSLSLTSCQYAVTMTPTSQALALDWLFEYYQEARRLTVLTLLRDQICPPHRCDIALEELIQAEGQQHMHQSCRLTVRKTSAVLETNSCFFLSFSPSDLLTLLAALYSFHESH